MKKISYLVLTLFFFSNSAFAISLSDFWDGEKSSQFRNLKVVSAKDYMVSSAHTLASEAGAKILEKGGNAIDAAIAIQLVLNVVEPQSSGIGGGGFLLYYDAKSKKTSYFNGRERAPAKAFETMFLDKDGKAREFRDAVQGGSSVATPGLLKMLKAAHDKYGKLAWNELFESAIEIAKNGFEFDERLKVNIKDITYLKKFKESREIYFKEDGSNYEVGEVIKNPKLAKTFEIIANEGIKPFYEGRIAKDIVNSVQNSEVNPGYLSLADLKNYQIKKGELVCANYRVKYKICSMPLPSSGGITILQILGILENFDLTKLKPNSAKAIHLISEAARLSYADRNEYVADVPNAPIKQMLDKKYLKKRSKMINLKTAPNHFNPGNFSQNKSIFDIATSYKQAEPLSTTHMSVLDKEGNAVSFTSSIEYFFGSALSVDGFLLNNHMTDFSFIPEIDGKKVANRVEPFKQPRSSMSPTFVFDENNKLIMVVGSPGGPRIIQFVAKTIIAHLDWKMNIQEAISLPNFVVLNDTLELEKNTKITKLQKALEKMGHKVKITDLVSGIHAITINDNGIKGGADPRRSGVAIGK